MSRYTPRRPLQVVDCAPTDDPSGPAMEPTCGVGLLLSRSDSRRRSPTQRSFAASALLGLLILCADPAAALTRNVPSDYASIQAAIDASVDGDSVIVAAGTYGENIDFHGKNVALRGTGGRGACTIDGGARGAVVTATSGEITASILGITLTNGSGAEADFPEWGPCRVGGGVFIAGASLVLRDCVVTGNTVTGRGANGGGLFCRSGSLVMENCVITNNSVSATALGGCGGGLFLRGYQAPTSAYLTNCLLTGNTASNNGGAIEENKCSLHLTNVTVSGNRALGGNSGGALRSVDGDVVVRNSIVWANSLPQIVYSWSQSMRIEESLLQGGQTIALVLGSPGVTWGAGNIDSDPMFVSPSDYSLQRLSPAVDAGSIAYNSTTSDLNGSARQADGNGDGAVEIDMGALERPSPPPNAPPSLVLAASTTFPVGVPSTLSLSATDPDGDQLIYSATGSPSGSSLVGNTFSWSPTWQQTGTHEVTFSVTDGKGGIASQTVTLTVDDPGPRVDLASLAATPSVIDITGGAGYVTISARALDTDPGIQWPSVQFRNDAGDQLGWALNQFASGTSNDGIWRYTAMLDQWSTRSGTYRLAEVSVRDQSNNQRTYSASDLAQAGVSVSFTVNGPPPDTSPPSVVLSSVAIAGNPVVNIASGSPSLTISARAIDVGSGVQFPSVQFRNNAGQQLGWALNQFDSGDNQDGTWRYTVTHELTSAAVGTYNLTEVSVRDRYGNQRQYSAAELAAAGVALSFTLSTNNPPVMDAIGPRSGREGELLSFSLAAADADGDPVTYAMAGAPTGAVLSGNGFSWTPGYDQAGTYSVTFTAADARGGTDTEAVSIIVADYNRPPTILPIGAQTVAEGSSLSISVLAADPEGTPVAQLLYGVSGQPAGANMVGNTFTWTPGYEHAGTYTVTFSVSDGQGATANQAVTITVTNTNRPPVLGPVVSPSVTAGAVASIPLVATDPDGDVVTFAFAGTPPASCLVGSLFSWTTSTPGTFPLTFTASDGKGGSAGATATVTVIAANVAPSLSLPVVPASVAVNTQMMVALTATDPDGDPLTYTALSSPPAAATSAVLTGGVFTWTPTQTGSYPITFSVSDGKGGTDSKTVTVNVVAQNRPPILAPVPSQIVTVGMPVSFTLQATDVDGDPLSYTVSGAPRDPFGAGAGAATQVLVGNQFSWTPPVSLIPDTYTAVFTVTDGRGGSSTQTTTITVLAPNRPPTINPLPDTMRVAVGTLLSFPFGATDPDGDALTYSLASNVPPPGPSPTLNGATFFWTPTATQLGPFAVTITASDGRGGAANESFTVVVYSNHAPVLAAIPSQAGMLGTPLAFTLSASDPDGDVLSFSYAFVGAPPPQPPVISVMPTGVVTWLQTQPGTCTVAFTVSDGKGGVDSKATTIAIVASNRPPVLAALATPTLPEGSPLTLTLSATDVDGDALTYSVSGNPTGSLLSGSTFIWTPSYTQAGSYTLTFSVSDDKGGTDSKTVTITVTSSNRPPTLASLANQSVTAGSTITVGLSATDPDNDPLSYSVTGSPAGASFAGSMFSWTPTTAQAGTYLVTFTVSDYNGGTDSKTLSITVIAGTPPVVINTAPRWTVLQPVSVTVGDTLRLALQASDPDGDSVHYLLAGNPAGLTLTGDRFLWVPTAQQLGANQVTFTASDQRGGNTPQTVTITVNPPPARVTATPLLLDFGQVQVGHRDTLMVRVTNASLQSISSYTFSPSRGFTTIPDHLSLAPGASAVVQVVFAPTAAEAYDAVLTLNFDVTYSEVTLRGSGVSGNRPPVPVPLAEQTVAEGDTLRVALTAHDADGDTVLWRVTDATTLGGMEWCSVKGSELVLAPHFSAAGRWQVGLWVTDGRSEPVLAWVPVTVSPTNRAPSISQPAPITAIAGDTITLALDARDPDGDRITTSLANGPPGARLEGLDFTWPTARSQVGLFTPFIVVTDALGDTSVVQLSILLVTPSVTPPRLEVQSTLLDLDVVAVGQASRVRKVPVRNIGGSPLELYDLTVSQPTFRVAQQDSLPLVIAAGATRYLDLTFKPTVVGIVRGELTLYSNDAELPEFVVRLRGEGQQLGAFEPRIVTEVVRFGLVAGQPTARALLLVRNQGALDGQVRLVADDPGITAAQAMYAVAAGAVVSIDLVLDAAARQTSTGRLTLETTPATPTAPQVDWVVEEYLELVDADPLDGAMGVPLETELVLYFSVPLAVVGDRPTIDVRLQPMPVSGAVDRSIRLSSSGRMVTLPVELAANTVYELVVLSAEGRAGQQLSGRVRQRFTTGSAPLVSGSITGQVLAGGAPAVVARVYLADAGKQVIDEAEVGFEGRYLFEDVPVGSYQVFAREPSSQVSASFDADGDGVGDLLSVRAGQQLAGIDLQLGLGDAPAADKPAEVGLSLSLDLDPAVGDQAVTQAPVSTGETVTVSLYVQGVAALSGFSASVAFDTAQVQLVRVREDAADERCLLYQAGGTPLFLQDGSQFGGALLAPSAVTAVDGSGLLAVWTLRTTAAFTGQAVVTLGEVVLRSLTGRQVLQPGSQVTLRQPQVEVASPVTMDLDLSPGDQELCHRRAPAGCDIPVQLTYQGTTAIRGFGVQLSFDPAVVRVPLEEFAPGQTTWLPVVRSLAEGQAEMGAALLTGTMSQPELGVFHVHVDAPLTADTEVILRRVVLRLADGRELPVEVDARITLQAGGMPGDFDGNGEIDFSDFFLFADAFSNPVVDPLYDLNSDGEIDFSDFFIFADLFAKPERAKLMELAQQYLGLPRDTRLEAVYPNPFNASTTLRYRLSEPGPVRLAVYGLTGQLVASLAERRQEVGLHEVTWDGLSDDGSPAATGVYVVRLEGTSGVQVRKVTLLR